jgi:hypothetical protein
MGRTATGHATIELLDLNDDRHDGAVVRVRQRDRSAGYHPPPEDPVLSVEMQADFDFLTIREQHTALPVRMEHLDEGGDFLG